MRGMLATLVALHVLTLSEGDLVWKGRVVGSIDGEGDHCNGTIGLWPFGLCARPENPVESSPSKPGYSFFDHSSWTPAILLPPST
jgi:hypothetical protein